VIETILRLQETRLGPGRYSGGAFLELVRHPYLKMLKVAGPNPCGRCSTPGRPWCAGAAGTWTPFPCRSRGGRGPRIRGGHGRGHARRGPDPADRVRHVCLTAFEDVSTPRRLGDALAGLVGFCSTRSTRGTSGSAS
jgi:hypothetical protein